MKRFNGGKNYGGGGGASWTVKRAQCAHFLRVKSRVAHPNAHLAFALGSALG
mgnify:CR=1 FL=1